MRRAPRALFVAVVTAGMLGLPARPALACVTISVPGESAEHLQARQVREAEVVFVGRATRSEVVEQMTEGAGLWTAWSSDGPQAAAAAAAAAVDLPCDVHAPGQPLRIGKRPPRTSRRGAAGPR